MAIPAMFDSECVVCDGAIFEGDMIVKTDGEWAHEECVDPDDVDTGAPDVSFEL